MFKNVGAISAQQLQQQQGRRSRVTYTVGAVDSAAARHCSGVNSLALDVSSQTLYSASRDSTVRAWALSIDFERMRESAESGSSMDDHDASFDLDPVAPSAAANHSYGSFSEASPAPNHATDRPKSKPSKFSATSDHIVIPPRSSSAAAARLSPSKSSASSVSSVTSPTTPTAGQTKKLSINPTTHIRNSGGWVASGGLDRRVMIWDTNESRNREIVGFSVSASEFCHDKSPKASIYALACNPGGTAIVSGSPDKIIRVWDPRSGKQAIGLNGHRDNIRALLISDDGKWVISASSDTTIKLWSLAQPQRCMVTYTHYEDSVWCLYSNHPDLDTFWAGGRDGLVTKMSRRRVGGESKGRRIEDELVDCVAVCKESGPVSRLVAVDDMFIWTATDKSSINRWRDIPFHNATVVSSRASIPEGTDAVFIPAASIIQHQSGANDSNTENKTENDVLSQSGASVTSPSVDAYSFKNLSKKSITGTAQPLFSSSFVDFAVDDEDGSESVPPVEPVWLKPDHVVEGSPGICKFALMNNRMHVVTENTAGGVSLWDIVKCVKIADFEESVSFKEACERSNTFEWIANWCSIDIKNGFLSIHLDESKFSEAEVYYENVDPNSPSEDQRVNVGKWVLSYLFISYMHVCQQSVSSAAAMYHDHYLGALTYTQLGAPPGCTHYLFGQTAYYGPAEYAFADLMTVNTLQQKKISDSRSTASINARSESNVEDPVTNSSGESTMKSSSPPAVRLRPRTTSNVANMERPESVIYAEQALAHVRQIVEKPVPYSPNVEEIPVIRIPPDVCIIVSMEESPEAACYLDQFRSTVGQIGWVREALRLDECLPLWVYEVLYDKRKLKETPKMSFTLVPRPFSELPDLPNNSAKLSSNRMIRLRKLIAYVAEQAKIPPPERLVKAALEQREQQRLKQAGAAAATEAGAARADGGDESGSPNSGSASAGGHSTAPSGNVGHVSDVSSQRSGIGGIFRRKRSVTGGNGSSMASENKSTAQNEEETDIKDLVKPEDYLVLYCQDKILDPKMTLGTVKNLIWKSGGGDLTLTYRLVEK
ncbi:hypothetical protein HDU82_008053 [Entophlyctis luteolus]|nr:hypothetical protein HDU82_008053 [Entophlyctis luteolus]